MGDNPGHDFRGNQFTTGGAGGKEETGVRDSAANQKIFEAAAIRSSGGVPSAAALARAGFKGDPDKAFARMQAGHAAVKAGHEQATSGHGHTGLSKFGKDLRTGKR